MASMVVPARFNGPPDSGNGGYTAGLVAGFLRPEPPGVVVVTLRRPPPLDTPLDVEANGSGVRVRHGDVLVAEAAPADLDGLPPVPPEPYEEAVRVSAGYPGFGSHPFPTCFTCGPGRAPGDGLRIFPGRLPGNIGTVAPWLVGEVSAPVVWAALDCPGGWATDQEERPHVLGRIAVAVHALPAPGDACVVTGRVLAVDGRKAQVATTLYGPDGALLAQASATWVALRPPDR